MEIDASPKIALILYGQPRFVSTRLAAYSQMKLLKGLNVSIFGHVWFSESQESVSTSSWSKLKSLKLDKDSLKIIRKSWPGIIMNSEEPINFEVTEFLSTDGSLKNSPKLGPGANTLRNASNTISQLYSINQALLLANSVNVLEPFDYYILTRYDCLINYFPPFKKWLNQKLMLTSHHDFPDPFIVGAPALVNATNAFDNWQKYARDSEFFLTPEEIKKLEFINHYSVSDYINLNSRVEFIRSNSKASGLFLLFVKMSIANRLKMRAIGKLRFEWVKFINYTKNFTPFEK